MVNGQCRWCVRVMVDNIVLMLVLVDSFKFISYSRFSFLLPSFFPFLLFSVAFFPKPIRKRRVFPAVPHSISFLTQQPRERRTLSDLLLLCVLSVCPFSVGEEMCIHLIYICSCVSIYRIVVLIPPPSLLCIIHLDSSSVFYPPIARVILLCSKDFFHANLWKWVD